MFQNKTNSEEIEMKRVEKQRIGGTGRTFTLIELLVVIVIIANSTPCLSARPHARNGKRFRAEAERRHARTALRTGDRAGAERAARLALARTRSEA